MQTRDIYDRFVSQKVLPPKAEEKWLQENIEANWNSVTKNKIVNQLEPKIREFNYNFLNKILATNKNLYTWKISDSYNCLYCIPRVIEHTGKHLLWDCQHIQEIWAIFPRVFNIDINWSIIVKGVKGNHYINQLLALLMYVIYKKFQT